MIRLRRPSPAMVVALAGLGVALSGTSYAATGANFVLGQANTANHVSTLKNGKGAALTLTSGGSATALTLNTPAGAPPLKVSSSTVVPGLNADLLDGSSVSDLHSAVLGSQLFAGPLPHTLPGTWEFTGNPALVTVSGSAYRTVASGAGYLTVAVVACPGAVSTCDFSNPAASPLGGFQTFANETNSHHSIAFSLVARLPAGTYTLAVLPADNDTTTDANDAFELTAVSLG